MQVVEQMASGNLDQANESILFDDPLAGLTSQVHSKNLEEPGQGGTVTPKRRKGLGTLTRKQGSFSSSRRKSGKNSSSSSKKARTSERKSRVNQVSPWDKAISKSPALAKFVKRQLEMEKQLEKVELKVVEVPRNDLQFID